jgi:7,8-dihydropterin-6-yl-methyl-4-(beta-D-ribofuranosyl)aminobenzene 5'-phosphate synthase
MKPICLSLWAAILIFMAACSSTKIAPAQDTATLNTMPAPTNIQTTGSTPSAIATQIVVSPTPTEEVIIATQTTEIKNEVVITGTQIVTITVVYDNNPYDPRLTPAWGFSALVEYHGYTLLFDSGGDGQILLNNMRTLGIDPAQIDSVVLSHAHDDHTAGLTALLDTGIKPGVYLLPSFPASFKRQIQQYTQIYEVSSRQSITTDIWTTGEIGAAVPEQALVIQTEQGLVVITGCAHPGIVAMVKQAQDTFNAPILLVMGGFHLVEKSQAEIETIVRDFELMEVKNVAPCHCTGETAIAQFSTVYGDNFVKLGVGSTIHLKGNTIE